MKEFIEKYDEVFHLFEKHGFKDPLIHRRMVGINSDKVLIFMTDSSAEKTQSQSCGYRIVDLNEALKKYLKCAFLLLTSRNLQSHTVEELGTPKYPAVCLTRNLSSREIAKELIRIFGEQWVGVSLAEVTTEPADLVKTGWSPTVFSGAPLAHVTKLDLEPLLSKLDILVEEYIKQHPALKKEDVQQQIASHFALPSPTKTVGPE